MTSQSASSMFPLNLDESLIDSVGSVENERVMVTDRAPRKAAPVAAFLESDRSKNLAFPPGKSLEAAAEAIESMLASGTRRAIEQACTEFTNILADYYNVEAPSVRILAARPIRTREAGWATEIFGDNHPRTKVIRVWTRTAVRKQITSFGTFLSTLCHEFCHHLDFARFRYGDSWHTRGFFERTAALYHHARGTPSKRLFWTKASGGRWRIDWQRTSRGF